MALTPTEHLTRMADAGSETSSGAVNRLWCVDSPGWGGSEINLCRIWSLLQLDQQHVVLNTTTALELRQKCHLHRHTCVSVPSHNSAGHAFTSLFRANRLLQRLPDAEVVVWAHHSDSNRWMQLMLALQRRSFVLVEQIVPASNSAFERSRLTKPIKRFVAGRARAVVLNGYSQEQHYMELFGIGHAAVRVIPNSRPAERIHETVRALKREQKQLRSTLGISGAPVIVCIARLSGQKDQATLIRAMAQMRQTIPGAQLVLVGDGPDREQLETLAQTSIPGSVLFAGYREDPLPWLAAADVFVLPSLSEGLPGALIEAMAASVPCIATEIPGNNELVQHEKTGLTFQIGQHDMLAGHICRFLQNPGEASRFSESAFQLVRNHYDEQQEQIAWQKLLIDE